MTFQFVILVTIFVTFLTLNLGATFEREDGGFQEGHESFEQSKYKNPIVDHCLKGDRCHGHDRDRTCCLGTCCYEDELCLCNEGQCGGCCPIRQVCGDKCCPKKAAICCGGNCTSACCNGHPFDVDKGESCCGGSVVCGSGQKCCGKTCCPDNANFQCCGTSCCSSEQRCCDDTCCTSGSTCCNGFCCPSDEVCCGTNKNTKHCCPRNQCLNPTSDSEARCCPSGYTACGGVCCDKGNCTFTSGTFACTKVA